MNQTIAGKWTLNTYGTWLGPYGFSVVYRSYPMAYHTWKGDKVHMPEGYVLRASGGWELGTYRTLTEAQQAAEVEHASELSEG